MRLARRVRPAQALLLLWTLVGAAWLGAALIGWADAPSSQRRVYVLPIVAGAMTSATGAWAFVSEVRSLRKEGGPPGASTDAATGPGTVLDVLVLGALLIGAWLLMPVLGLVLTAVFLFLAFSLVYRDLGWRGTTVNVVILFALLAYGAGQLLNMPLMRSQILNLPF